ncbi:acyl-CoA dehydrogenase family protein [Bacillus alkalicellulosilyticus]|uniref:acyl-CoA dehydrogenase family protein n=1 Tax=Alkalihalobacterium alkalicellulosilyticum TaxID=1912214 RepID=UPI0009966646|nr:acyl-CoA dehydrogenase family protein [Bacillus alkalicellulosilyticus]
MVFLKSQKQRNTLQEIGKMADEFGKRALYYEQQQQFPFENMKDLRNQGYTTLTLPQSLGGQGATLYEFLLMQERLAQGCGSTALGMGWHLGCVLDICEDNNWEKDVYHEIMNAVKNGALLNRAATERATGSPTRGGKPETTATEHEDHWVIHGRKTFTTLAPALDFYLVSASITGSEEVGDFLIHKGTKGVSIDETWDSIAMQSTGSHDLVLDNVKIDKRYFLETIGPKRKMKANAWLLHIPACYLGIAQAARTYALNFASSYQPNSIQTTISELPNVRRLIGEIELELKQARHMLYSVAEKWENTSDRESFKPELAAVKHTVTNNAISIVDKAMRIVGARSLSAKNPLQRYYRDVRAGLHNPPMDDATIALLAQSALDGLKTDQ